MPKILLVAAIDFGTTYSGYAFSTITDYESDPLNIQANQAWVAGGKYLLSLKTPTCLLLNKDQNFVSFGFEAENTYSDFVLENLHHDYYYFERFKMRLHNNKELSKSTVLEDIRGKSVKAMKVFALSIEALKEHMLQTLDNQGTGIQRNEIQWVLTVPAIWTDQAKQFMRSAAEEAGIPKHQLKIALEPEAASMYCQKLPIDRLRGAGQGFTMTEAGTKYMVVDLGGGTADITVHEKLADGKLKELYKASGGACGGTAVDSKFIQNVIIKIVGAPLLNDMKETYPSSYLDLFREFETVKRTVGPDKEGKVNFSIPYVILDKLCKEHLEDSFENCLKISPISDKITLLGDKMRIDATMFKGFFKEPTDEIVKHLKEIMSKTEAKGVSIFLLVGGFSESLIVQDAIKKAFPSVRIVIPADCGLSVLKGAVIYGHKPDTIASRVMRYSYGVRTTPDFDVTKHRNDKKFIQNGSARCSDVFCSFVKASTHVPVNHEDIAVYSTTRPFQDAMDLKIYYSTEDDPKYVDDECCHYLGSLDVKIPNPSEEERNMAVQYVFGDTELKVLAVEVQSKTPCAAEFKLLN